MILLIEGWFFVRGHDPSIEGWFFVRGMGMIPWLRDDSSDQGWAWSIEWGMILHKGDKHDPSIEGYCCCLSYFGLHSVSWIPQSTDMRDVSTYCYSFDDQQNIGFCWFCERSTYFMAWHLYCITDMNKRKSVHHNRRSATYFAIAKLYVPFSCKLSLNVVLKCQNLMIYHRRDHPSIDGEAPTILSFHVAHSIQHILYRVLL